MLFTCGSSLKGLEVENRSKEGSDMLSLFERVYVRENLTCDDSVEIPYYSSEKFILVCTNCACTTGQTESREGQYPLCDMCREQGKQPILKRKRKMLSS